jgi:hypothetical protein
MITGWEDEPHDEAAYAGVTGGNWTAGVGNSVLMGVCHRLLTYAKEQPESVLSVLSRIKADYDADPRCAGKSERDVRRA